MDVFFPFLNIGFSFATLQAFGKTPRESLSIQAALELLIFCMIFKTF